MTPQFLHFPETRVVGIATATTNAREATPATASIPELWGRFMGESLADHISNRVPDDRMFGVYTDYESDHRGCYTNAVTVEVSDASAPPDGMTGFVLPAGTYLVFDCIGEMPAAVVSGWQDVWHYFDSSRMQRAYTADFEVYDRGAVSIYIAILESSMQTEMMDAVKAGDVDKVKTLLATDPALVNAKDDQGNSAVLIASYWGKTTVRDALLAAHPALNVFEAAAAGANDRVKELVTRDTALINAFSHDGFTPLHLAVFFGHINIAQMLLTFSPDVRAVSRNPMMVQPLHSAAAGNHYDICKELLERGADVNAVQQDGFTPLMAAAQNGNIALTELFLRHGADPHVVATGGKTAHDFAVEGGHEAVAALV